VELIFLDYNLCMTNEETNSIEPSSIYDLLTKFPYVEVTNGFPVNSAEELWDLFYNLLQKGHISRIPIIGMNDGRIFLRASSLKNDHQTLLDQLHQNFAYSETTIAFTASLESFVFIKPEGKNYLKLVTSDGEIFIPIGTCSDVLRIPLENVNDLEPVFGKIKDVEIVT
jgi:hypothetical protein